MKMAVAIVGSRMVMGDSKPYQMLCHLGRCPKRGLGDPAFFLIPFVSLIGG